MSAIAVSLNESLMCPLHFGHGGEMKNLTHPKLGQSMLSWRRWYVFSSLVRTGIDLTGYDGVLVFEWDPPHLMMGIWWWCVTDVTHRDEWVCHLDVWMRHPDEHAGHCIGRRCCFDRQLGYCIGRRGYLDEQVSYLIGKKSWSRRANESSLWGEKLSWWDVVLRSNIILRSDCIVKTSRREETSCRAATSHHISKALS